MSVPSIEEARTILGDDVLGPDEVKSVFGVLADDTAQAIPFDQASLTQARKNGEMLVFRAAKLADGRGLTIAGMIAAFPDAFDPKFLTKMGYQLKDEWGISLEPLATADTCRVGWSLVRKDLVVETRNLAYEQQDAVLEKLGAGSRRRSGVEIVFDTLLYWKARNARLLSNSWDWSSTRTLDGGYLNVGGFSNAGLQIFSYSRAVRHGGLGICPTRP